MKTTTENQLATGSPSCYASSLPETEAVWDAYQMDSTCDEGDPWGLAARLERERDAAEKQLRDLVEACNQYGGGASLSHPRYTRQLSAVKKFLHNAESTRAGIKP